MANLISLKDFLDDYGESMAEKVVQDLSVIHDPATEKEEEISLGMLLGLQAGVQYQILKKL